jgi:hypothetical protein
VFPKSELDELVAWLRGRANPGFVKLVADATAVLNWGVGLVGGTTGQAQQAQAQTQAAFKPEAVLAARAPQQQFDANQAADELEALGRQYAADQSNPPQGAQAGLFGGGKFIGLILQILQGVLASGVLSGAQQGQKPTGGQNPQQGGQQ